ncbi:MAG: matrixin family metalloprotease [Bryobacteraceae bacterium]
MPFIRVAALAWLLFAQLGWAQNAIRLKTRTIDPQRAVGQGWPVGRALVGGRHYLLQFPSYPGPEVREELARRRIRVLGYVPDNTLAVLVGVTLNLEGLGVSWAGALEAEDKISPVLATHAANAFLVIYYADVDMQKARALAHLEGFEVLENPSLLPAQLLLIGAYQAIWGLAAWDEVSYIMPASTDLLAGTPVMGCPGPLTEAGPIGDYVEVGNGWSKDPNGGVALKYYFETLTNKMDASTVQSEIERAFQEWARHANISYSPGQAQGVARSMDILFASGAHGDAYPFDGPGGVLAHTFYPAPLNSEPIAGDMHFDANENWHAGSNTDLFSVALHEAGHALGLGHSSNPGAVMYPYYRMQTGLTADDIAGVRALYGAAVTPPVASGPTTPVQPPVQTPAQPPAASPPTTPVQPPAQPPVQTPAQPPARGDTTPPSLSMVSPALTIVATSSASIAISGTASDNMGVAAVKWTNSNGDSGTASGTTHWSANVPLLVGNNVVTIRAYDAAGNSAWRAITVVRR